MIIDPSAVVAMVFDEPEAQACALVINAAPHRRMSAAGLLEAGIVLDRDPISSRRFDNTLRTLEIEIEPVTERQAQIAREAYRDFGRGRGNPAKLNFGDCFSYALAKDLNEPLLFVGDDFSKTDVKSALAAEPY